MSDTFFFFYMDYFLKFLLDLLQHCFCFMFQFFFFVFCFFVFYHKAWKILAVWPGIEPTAPALESEVSATGQPGKTHGTW